MARGGAQARSMMRLVTESCDSEAYSCIDGSSTNDASCAEERGAVKGLLAGRCGGVRVVQVVTSGGWDEAEEERCPKR
jgi:hypothetical protein